MLKKVALLILLTTVSSTSWAQSAYEQARGFGEEIVVAQLKGELCGAEPAPAETREALVEALARIDRAGLTDPTGLDPLSLAVISNDVPTIERIASLGYDLDAPSRALMHSAAFIGAMDSLAYLIEQGLDPNARMADQATPLMAAAGNGHLPAVRALIAAGASADARTGGGATALHYAIGCVDQQMVDVLLSAGAPVDPKAEELASRFAVDLRAGDG